MMTKQEIFNKVRDHLMAQNGPALGTSGECMYRTPAGGMCAIGCLLKDDPIIAEMEGKTITDLAERNSEIRGFFLENGMDLADKETVYFLDNLQDAHDDAVFLCTSDPKRWSSTIRAHLAMVAKRNNLEM